MRRLRLAALAGTLALTAVALPASGDPRGTHPQEVADALCERGAKIDSDCVNIPIPGQAWVVAALTKPRPGAEKLYDSLIRPPYKPAAQRQVAVLSSRLDIPGDASMTRDTDPGAGYQEGSIAIRVSLPPMEAGYPWTDGWLVLVQPINDYSQYEAGREVGIPKYLADMTTTKTAKGWRQVSIGFGAGPGQDKGIGSTTVKGGGRLIIDWTTDKVKASEQQIADVERWSVFGDPLVGHKRPFDDPKFDVTKPWLTKFTSTAYVPATQAAAFTPLTAGPDLEVGQTDVVLEGTIPGTKGVPFSRLVGPKQLTDIPGVSAYFSGILYITTDGLANNMAK